MWSLRLLHSGAVSLILLYKKVSTNTAPAPAGGPSQEREECLQIFGSCCSSDQGDLTRSGRTVADYLVQHAAEAQYLSISSLARECQVAEATVFRFCRALGFEGYHEMRIALAQANATGVLVKPAGAPAPDADHRYFVRARLARCS